MTAAEHLVEQLAFRAGPTGDLLAKPAVELAEVLFDRSKVGKQFASCSRELLVPVALAHGIEYGDIAALDPGDLLVEFRALTPQFGEAVLRVGVGAVHHLAEEFEDGVQP